MHNKVVYTIYRVLEDAGHPTLRFNFRGVGRSEGVYSGRNEEIGDIAAAAAFARERTGRLELSHRYRQDPGAHDVGDERAGVQNESEQDSGELRCET